MRGCDNLDDVFWLTREEEKKPSWQIPLCIFSPVWGASSLFSSSSSSNYVRYCPQLRSQSLWDFEPLVPSAKWDSPHQAKDLLMYIFSTYILCVIAKSSLSRVKYYCYQRNCYWFWHLWWNSYCAWMPYRSLLCVDLPLLSWWVLLLLLSFFSCV